MSPETTTALGRRGEDFAAHHLESQGLVVLERNFRCRGGEIDLMMREGGTLVLVEVRARSSGEYGGAAASVDGRKRRRFGLAARRLMQLRPAYRAMPARFDVVALDGPCDGRAAVTWIRDAFRMP